MRVLFVTALPPERSSFLGRTLPLAKEVRRAGHTVEIVTLSGEERAPFDAVEQWNSIPVQVVGPNIRATRVQAPPLGETWRRLRAGRRALSAVLASRTADVAVLEKPQLQNTEPTLAFARTRGIPLLLDADDFEPAASRFSAPVRWFMQILDRRAARAATAVTACSPFLVSYYQRLNPGARVELLPTGIDMPTEIPPARLRERLRLPADVIIILYVGSLSIASGHRADALLEAFSRLKTFDSQHKAHLVFVGSGLDEEQLKSQAAHSSLRTAHSVHFLGRFTPPEDIALAREADLLVDPVDQSVTAEAKSSHRMMLALATGTPIVAGNVGIRTLLLPPALHRLCFYEPGRPGDLAAALQRGLKPSLKSQFQEQTRGLTDQWSWDALGKRFVTLLESLRERVR